MRGSLVRRCRPKGEKRCTHRGKCRWGIVLDVGRTSEGKRQQKWISFRGNGKQAEEKLTELIHGSNRGEFVEPTKLTLGQWLEEWVQKAVKPPRRTKRTYESYVQIIRSHLNPKLGSIPLQQLSPLDVERYHADLALGVASGVKHQVILSAALKAAVSAGRLHRNVAPLATNKPRPRPPHEDALENVWTADEARAFLTVAKAHGGQPSALFGLFLDSGARLAEVQALRWSDVDFTTGQLRIERQRFRDGTYGPVKNKRPRALDLGAETLTLLQAHRKGQAEVKMANRQHYADEGLLFAQTWEDVRTGRDHIGAALNAKTIRRHLERLILEARVKRITVHGLRHTSATLLLAAGVQPHVVQKRLGHATVSITLDIYGHVIPAMQADAASRLGAVLHG